MGLLDTLLGWGYEALDNKLDGKISDFVNNETDKRDKDVNRVMKLVDNMQGKSDEEVKKIYKTGTTDMKRAAAYLLKQRGY